jgi:hypothetical protein
MLMVFPDDTSATKQDSYLEEYLPLFRAILAQKTQAANSADGTPVWGDAQDGQVDADSLDGMRLAIDTIEQRVNEGQINAGQSVGTAKPRMLTPAELHRLYADTSVPQHRYLAPSLAAAVNSPEIALDPAKWLTDISEVNLPRVMDAWLNTNRSTEYEQLNCVGLDPHTSLLTGVLKVKRGKGYSGGPCTAGSREFVAFWVDWGSGFQYEGTTSVAVHDFNSLPPAGLEYNVFLPVDLLSHMQPCGEAAKTVKVRAVLSWNTPPSTTDPKAPVVWGNSLERLIPISPDHALRASDEVLPRAVACAADVDQIGGGGRVIDAAIKALTGMTFGPYAGLTVVPDSAIAGPDVADQTFTINTAGMMECGYSFTLYVWDRTNVNRGTISDLNRASARFCLQAKS